MIRSTVAFLVSYFFAAAALAVEESQTTAAELGSPIVAIIFLVLFFGSIIGLIGFMVWKNKKASAAEVKK